MKFQFTILLSVLIWILVAQQVSSLAPTPRVNDNFKNSLQKPIKQDRDEFGKKYGTETSFNKTKDKNLGDALNNNQDDDNDDDDGYNDFINRSRFTLSEPYKSLIQTTTRFAVAQTSITNYVQIDTFMDLVNDTGYMLTSPNIFNKALRVTAVVLATLMTLLFFVPPTYWKALGKNWRNSNRLMELERFLPNGLNEIGIIRMLEEKTDEFLARFQLNDNECRQQSICQAGELLRCAFPKGSKSIVSFISENFSRPRYRDHEYIGSFLRGFVDRNCAANTEMDQSRTCFSSMIKSLSSCPASSFHSAPVTSKTERYQTIPVERA